MLIDNQGHVGQGLDEGFFEPIDPPPGTTGDEKVTPPPTGSDEKGNGVVPPADPLANLTLEQIQAHPVLGPQLQAQLDRAAAEQVAAAVDREKPKWDEEARLEARAKEFNDMPPDTLGLLLQTDPEAKRDYILLTQREERLNQGKVSEDVRLQGELHSIAQTIHVYSSLVEESDLAGEIKTQLNPDNFRDRGLAAYQTAVFNAFKEHEGKKYFETELKKAIDAAVQDKLAELDPQRPLGLPGSSDTGAFDILTTPGEALISSGLQKRQKS